MQGALGQCSNRRRVSNKRRVSIKRRGFKVRALINATAYTYEYNPYWETYGYSYQRESSLSVNLCFNLC